MGEQQDERKSWLLQRKGKWTASNLDCLLVKGKSESTLGKGAIELCHTKLAERLSDDVMEFKSEYTDWGHTHEPHARDMFETVSGMSVEEVGFIPAPKEIAPIRLSDISGGSPDGVVRSDKAIPEAIIECKCPATSKVHLATMLSKQVNDKKYMLQMQWNMYCTGSDKCYFISYDPRMTKPEHKMVIIDVPRDEEVINQIKERILIAETYLKSLEKQL